MRIKEHTHPQPLSQEAAYRTVHRRKNIACVNDEKTIPAVISDVIPPCRNKPTNPSPTSIIFRPSWQDTSRPQADITHYIATCYTNRRTFQSLPRPPFESTSWHHTNQANVWLAIIYRIHMLSRGSKKLSRWGGCLKSQTFPSENQEFALGRV